MYYLPSYNLHCLFIFVHGHSSDDDGKTPLLCAAKSGHDKVVAYLLTFEKVRTELRKLPEKVGSASVSYVQPFLNLRYKCRFAGLASFPDSSTHEPGNEANASLARFTSSLDFRM